MSSHGQHGDVMVRTWKFTQLSFVMVMKSPSPMEVLYFAGYFHLFPMKTVILCSFSGTPGTPRLKLTGWIKWGTRPWYVRSQYNSRSLMTWNQYIYRVICFSGYNSSDTIQLILSSNHLRSISVQDLEFIEFWSLQEYQRLSKMSNLFKMKVI